jgi:hypothetical protein
MPTEFGSGDSGDDEQIDYEELRRQMMGLAGSGSASTASTIPMRQPAPVTMADSGPQPSSVGNMIASSGRPAPALSTEVQPPSVGSIMARSSQPPAGAVKSGPPPSEIPQPLSERA